MLCRLHLELLQMHDHPNGSSTVPLPPSQGFNSFPAVTGKIHRAILEEFSDPIFDESFENRISQDATEIQDALSSESDPSHSDEHGSIDLQEFPWAAGSFGDVETAPVPLA
ncbi:hypothetical protein K439DRAFT_1619676 [Ramaria rubella]|nr:hypothetical protein K439DRAFT_1625087 [Ramaria rubella]KAF8580563.1 hypothetical protein K439DRAFT_1619676 [Ramaria rubella]